MAGKIQIQDIGDYAADRFDKLLRSAVLETDKRLKAESPVDTGRFRASWAIGQNAAPFQGQPPGDYKNSPPPLAIGYPLGQEKAGNVYSIHNNLPYAEPLADGHSVQAPAGWVDNIANDIGSFVQANARKIATSR